MDLRTTVAIIAAIIAIVSLIMTIRFQKRAQRYSEISILLAKFNSKQSRREAIRDWASEAMNAISSAYILVSQGHADASKEAIMVKLTAEIDKGRWLLPNLEHEHFGNNKESAFTGLRQGSLDDLVDVFDCLLNLDSGALPSPEIALKIMKSKRRFASAVQEKLEPRAVESDLAELSGPRI